MPDVAFGLQDTDITAQPHVADDDATHQSDDEAETDEDQEEAEGSDEDSLLDSDTEREKEEEEVDVSLSQEAAGALASPHKSGMPETFVEALKNPASVDPEILEQALAWMPQEDSPSKLIEQARANKERKTKGIRLDIMTQPVPASYWKDIPRVFPTPFGPLNIAEMREQPEFSEALDAIMVDHATIVERCNNPQWLKENKVWVSQMGANSRQEAPLCTLARRLFLQNPTAKGCNNFVAGQLNTGDHANRGVVRLNCKKAGCTGQMTRDWDCPSLNAWFASKCKKQLEESEDVKDFVRFLFRFPCTLDALAFSEVAHEAWIAREQASAQSQLDKSAQAALAAATGRPGKTPQSAKSTKSKTPQQGQKQQGLGKFLVPTPGSKEKQPKGGEAAKNRAKPLSFSSGTPKGKRTQPSPHSVENVQATKKRKKSRQGPAARKEKQATRVTADGDAISRNTTTVPEDEDDAQIARRISELKARLAQIRASKGA